MKKSSLFFLILSTLFFASCFSNKEYSKIYDIETGYEIIESKFYESGIGAVEIKNKQGKEINLQVLEFVNTNPRIPKGGILVASKVIPTSENKIKFDLPANSVVIVNGIENNIFGRCSNKIVID